MKIMIVLTDSRRGGTPHKLAAITRAMVERGYDISFVTVMHEGEVARELKADGVQTHSLGVTSWSNAFLGLYRLRKLIKTERPALIQTALWHADLLGRLAAAGTPSVVLNSHENVDDDKSSLRITADRITHRLARRHVALTATIADHVSRRDHIPRHKIEVIGNGIDADEWQPRGEKEAVRAELGVPSSAPVMGWVGRLVKQKNVGDLIEVLSRLPGWWLVAAGYGPEKEDFLSLAERRGVRDRTVLLDEVGDVRRLLEAFDVYCLTSDWEGTPIALLEAMAAGLPVVATTVGGVPELITDRVDGLLVPPRDPDAAAIAVQEAKERPDLGAAAERSVRERFSQEAMIELFEKLWREAV